jgi:hypothetical protein
VTRRYCNSLSYPVLGLKSVGGTLTHTGDVLMGEKGSDFGLKNVGGTLTHTGDVLMGEKGSDFGFNLRKEVRCASCSGTGGLGIAIEHDDGDAACMGSIASMERMPPSGNLATFRAESV